MAVKRPHFSANGTQLQRLFEASRSDKKVLKELLAELKHRSTPSAVGLRKKVEAALLALSGDEGKSDPASGSRSSSTEGKVDSDSTIKCRGCEAELRVGLREGQTGFACPKCKSEFEVTVRQSVVHIVWNNDRDSLQEKEEEMSEEVARTILGVSGAADFSAIKMAWRKASQQYHPDKHQELPERLRRAAEREMRLINEAYRFLEGSTGTDF